MKFSDLRVLLVVNMIALSGHAGAESQIYRCVGAHGEIVFSHSRCSENAQIVEMPDTSPPTNPYRDLHEEYRQPRLAGQEEMRPQVSQPRQRLANPYSFLCEAANGSHWYQHDPCPTTIHVTKNVNVSGPTIGRTTSGQIVHLIGGRNSVKVDNYVPVTQRRVPTSVACENGAGDLDTYYRVGASPCTFNGSMLRLQAQRREQP